MTLPPPTSSYIARHALRSKPSNGVTSFVLQCRKLVFEYCEQWPSNKGLRDFLDKDVVELARKNGSVEVVVKQRPFHQPIVRGFYMNGREKTIGLRNLPRQSVASKVQLLLDSSGAKIKPLKRHPVESSNESVRGVWSPLHGGDGRVWRI